MKQYRYFTEFKIGKSDTVTSGVEGNHLYPHIQTSQMPSFI